MALIEVVIIYYTEMICPSQENLLKFFLIV
jgi:hypothetical protein